MIVLAFPVSSALIGILLNLFLIICLKKRRTDYSQNLRIINFILIICLPLLFLGKYGKSVFLYFDIVADEGLTVLLQSIFPFYGVNLLAHIFYNRMYFKRITR